MQQACYCGRVGDFEDQQPILDARGELALRCPGCGYIDHLLWLSEDARSAVFEEAERRSGRWQGSEAIALPGRRRKRMSS